jgi:ketosteroid isomerase-like protein
MSRISLKYTVAAIGLVAGIQFGGLQAANAGDFNNPTDVQAITKIEQSLAAATNMKSIIGYYAPTAIVYDIFSPGIYKGRAQIYAAFQKQFDGVSYVASQIPDLNVASDGNFACAAMQITTQDTLKSGAKFPVTVRQIDAFKKIDGKWQIVQEHLSVPADPKTGMAVWDGPVIPGGPLPWTDVAPLDAPVPVGQAKAEIEKWLHAGALSMSIDQMMTTYGPDNNVLVFDEYTPGVMHGRQAVHDYYAPVMGSFDHVTDNFTSLRIDTDGHFGVLIAYQALSMHLKSGGYYDMSIRESDCVKRVGGKWYTFLEENSFPADVKTGKSIVKVPGAFTN